MIPFETAGALVDRSERTTLERAVVAALAGLERGHGGYLAALDLYAGEMLANDLDELKGNLRGRAPAVLVSVGDIAYSSKSTARRVFAATLELRLLVVSNHLRSLVARAHGDEVSAVDSTVDPGVNRILVDCRDRLAGEDLGLGGYAPLLPIGEERLVEVADLTVFEATYRTSTEIRPRSPSLQPAPAITAVDQRHNLVGAGRATNPTVVAEASVNGDTDG